MPSERWWWDEIALFKECVPSQGNYDEFLVFTKLSHNADFVWFTFADLAEESRLPQEKVQEILQPHIASGLVVPHPTEPNYWGERGSVGAWLK